MTATAVASRFENERKTLKINAQSKKKFLHIVSNMLKYEHTQTTNYKAIMKNANKIQLDTLTKETVYAAYEQALAEVKEAFDICTALLDDLYNIDFGDDPVEKARAKREGVESTMLKETQKLDQLSEQFVRITGLAIYYGYKVDMDMLRMADYRVKHIN